MVNGHPEQVKNLYVVCMDDPIHPDDTERYDLRRAQREMDRQRIEAEGPQPKKRPARSGEPGSSLESQNETQVKSGTVRLESQFETQARKQASLESQIETPYLPSQNETPDTTYLPAHIETAIDYLPSGNLLTKENLTPGGEVPPKNPPEGDSDLLRKSAGEDEAAGEACAPCEPAAQSADPLQAVWDVALSHLATLVNRPTLNAHLKPMRLVSVTDTDVALLAPTAFSRTWIEGRHRAEVEAALGEALGRAVMVRITVAGGK
jgi:hypothetical protein